VTYTQETTDVRNLATASDLRAAMVQWASGVTVITAVDGERRPHGFTASSFCSVSLSPPLVLVCLDHAAACLDAFRGSDWFAIHVLREGQEELALAFARKGVDKFAGRATESGLGGTPLLPGGLARLECRMVDRIPAGDHLILLGQVARTATRPGRPLVYCQREFHGLSERRPLSVDPTRGG